MESALTQIAMGEDGEVWFLLLLDVLDVLFYHNIFLIFFFLTSYFRLGTPRCERVRPVRLVRPLTLTLRRTQTVTPTILQARWIFADSGLGREVGPGQVRIQLLDQNGIGCKSDCDG